MFSLSLKNASRNSAKNLMFKKLPISHTRLSSRIIITAAVMVSASAVPTLSAQAYERIVALSPDVAESSSH